MVTDHRSQVPEGGYCTGRLYTLCLLHLCVRFGAQAGMGMLLLNILTRYSSGEPHLPPHPPSLERTMGAGNGMDRMGKEGEGWGVLILSSFLAAFATIVDGKNEEMSTSELSGGARIHYIFQAIFVKRLEVGGGGGGVGCQLSLQGGMSVGQGWETERSAECEWLSVGSVWF